MVDFKMDVGISDRIVCHVTRGSVRYSVCIYVSGRYTNTTWVRVDNIYNSWESVGHHGYDIETDRPTIWQYVKDVTMKYMLDKL